MLFYKCPKNETKEGVFMKLNKLNAKIAEKEIKKKTLADKFGISQQALGKKLSGKTKMTVNDAIKFCDILKINNDKEKVEIFLK